MVSEIVNNYDTRDPEKIIKHLNIGIINLSPNSKEKSFSLKSYDKNIIVIKPGLKEDEYNYRLAHELGHIFIHFNKCNHTHSFGKNKFQKNLDVEADYFAEKLLNHPEVTACLN